MNRRGRLWQQKIAFPLERLFGLIDRSIWSDTTSEQIWTGAASTGGSAGVGYQLWDRNPADGTKLLLQDIEMTCPWCVQTRTIPLSDFTQCHTTKHAICRCTSCDRQFNADSLSAKIFVEDVREFLKFHNPWLIRYKRF